MMPLSVQNDINLETTDKSLFKRLQYAKEILVQMMSVQSMPPTLALTNQAKPDMMGQTNEDVAPLAHCRQNYASQQKPLAGPSNLLGQGLVAINPRQSVEQPSRHTKSASKNAMMMSPYTSKTGAKGKDQARTYRMQTLTASKTQTTTTNLLNSNAKQSSKKQFELPLLSNRSNSKPSLV